jgi:hypothetical protein
MKLFASMHATGTLVLMSAMLSAASFAPEASAATKEITCIGSACVGTHGDTGWSKYTTVNNGDVYRAIQWIGTAGTCYTKDADPGKNYCTYSYTKTSTGSVSWTIGHKQEFSAKINDVASWKAEFSATYSKTRTDTDTVGKNATPAIGQTVVPYSYVRRQPKKRTWTGAWIPTGSRYTCKVVFKCQKYVWDANYTFLQVNYKQSIEDNQTIEFKFYKNGTSSGLKLE